MATYNQSNLAFVFKLLLLLVAITIKCNICELDTEFEERVRKDAFRVTRPQENPYAVAIFSRNCSKIKPICSGTLLTSRWTLTSDHCLQENPYLFPREYFIYAGGMNKREVEKDEMPEHSQLLQVSEVIRHSQYDLVLLGVVTEFRLTKYINTVPFTLQPIRKNENVSCKITSFGSLFTRPTNPLLDYRRKTQRLTIVRPCPCRFRIWTKMRNVKPLEELRSDHFVCSLPKEDYGICHGDSGSGLICDGVLVAVSTALILGVDLNTCSDHIPEPQDLNRTNVHLCGKEHTLSIFTVIWHDSKWINSITQAYPDNILFSRSCPVIKFFWFSKILLFLVLLLILNPVIHL